MKAEREAEIERCVSVVLWCRVPPLIAFAPPQEARHYQGAQGQDGGEAAVGGDGDEGEHIVFAF